MTPLPPAGPGRWVLVVLVTRQLLDLATGVSVAGVPVNRVGTAALLVGLLAVAVRGPPPPRRWLAAGGLFVGAVGLAALHPTSTGEAARLGTLYVAPLVVAAAVWRVGLRPEQVLAAACMGAVVPVLTSIVALAAGQQHALVSHGYPRLTGLYANHHTLALTGTLTALFAAYLATRWSGVRRSLVLVLAGAALVTVAATYVRTALILLAVTSGVWLVLKRRWRLVGVIGIVGVAAALGVPALRERLSDIVAVLTLTAPNEGWAAIGSWRGAIWADALAAFVDRGPAAWLGGLGLGGHLQLWHKPLDPHSEPLALWFQLGVVGLGAWLALHAIAVHDLHRTRAPARAFALAVFAGAFATCLISNTFVARATPGWLLWALVAATVATSTPPTGSAARGAPAAKPGPTA